MQIFQNDAVINDLTLRKLNTNPKHCHVEDSLSTLETMLWPILSKCMRNGIYATDLFSAITSR